MAFSTSVAQRGISSPYDPFIVAAANKYGVPIALIKGVISQESSWIPDATHVDNPADPYAVSYGLMQLVWKYFKMPDGGPVVEPAANIDKGTALLGEQLRKRSGNIELAVAGYNAGTSRTDADLANRIANNTLGVANHVQSVLAYMQWFAANDPVSSGMTNGGGVTPPAPDWGMGEADLKTIAALVVGALLIFALLRR
ncbi:MAG TPA: transglycosylase SLT domain-containing protein [Terriglobia bacterium]|nr:transglycosylase SLT domain-containing protein [Terriglobia bacterium]